MKKSQSTKLEMAIHLLTAFVLLLKGFDKLAHGHYALGAIIFLFGLFVIVITVSHKQLQISHIKTKALVYTIEGIALLLIAYLYFNESKVYLPYFFLLPSIAFFIVAAITFKKNMKTS